MSWEERLRRMMLPPPDVTPYSAAEVAFSVAAWPMRAAEELRSALIYRALAQASRAAGVADEWITRFAAVAHEELGHARLCAAVGAALGAQRPRYDVRPVRARLAKLGAPLARATALLLVEVAMGETISMALFRAGRRGAREPLTRAVLQRIVADEVRHQRLGWAALTALWPGLPAAARATLQDEARRGLGAMEQQVAAPALARLQGGQLFEPAFAALGVLSPAVRVEAFYAAVETLVVPRLTRLGLDGAAAWADRYAQAAAKVRA